MVTDVLDVSINLRGGELDRADLLQYPLHKETPNIPVRLFDNQPGDSLYVVQTGLIGAAGEAAPTHLTMWSAAQMSLSYALAPGETQLRIPLTWTDGQGLKVTKTFIFNSADPTRFISPTPSRTIARGTQPRSVFADSASLGETVPLVLRCRNVFVQGAIGVRRRQGRTFERR